MKRAEWVKVKAEAAKKNGNKPVKFPNDMNLGPALDTYNTAETKRDKADIGKDPKGYVAAGEQWLAARQKVLVAATAYATALKDNKAQGEAAARAVLSMAVNRLLHQVSAQNTAKADTVTKNIARIKAGAAKK